MKILCLPNGVPWPQGAPIVTTDPLQPIEREWPMRVDANISDLFFNTDLSQTKLKDDRGHFTGYDEDKLKEEAQLFLSALDRLGVATPSVEDLIADYYGRI